MTQLPAEIEALVETWRPIPGRSGYEASAHGRIRSVSRVITCKDGRTQRWGGQMLRPRTKTDGHLTVFFLGKTYYVHALVMQAHVGPAPAGMECCHNDGDPSNNRLTNLRWDTHQANMLDKSRHGTWQQSMRTHCPLDHRLELPNLVRAALPRRHCLACNRGRSRIKYLRECGAQLPDLGALTDVYYDEIERSAGGMWTDVRAS